MTFFSEVLEDPTPNDPGATLLPKPPPVMYHFVSPGELGYTGYELFKGVDGRARVKDDEKT